MTSGLFIAIYVLAENSKKRVERKGMTEAKEGIIDSLKWCVSLLRTLQKEVSLYYNDSRVTKI